MGDCSVSIRTGSARGSEWLQLICTSDSLFSNPPSCSFSTPCTPHATSVRPTKIQTAHSNLNAEPTFTSANSLSFPKKTPSAIPFSEDHFETVAESPSTKASDAVPAATRRSLLRREFDPADLRRGKLRAARRTSVAARSGMQSRRAVGKSGNEKGS